MRYIVPDIDVYHMQVRKKDQINIESKLKTVRFIGEYFIVSFTRSCRAAVLDIGTTALYSMLCGCRINNRMNGWLVMWCVS